MSENINFNLIQPSMDIPLAGLLAQSPSLFKEGIFNPPKLFKPPHAKSVAAEDFLDNL